MKTLLLLSLFTLISCGGGAGGAGSVGSTSTSGNNGGVQAGNVVHGGYPDNNVQHFTYDVTNANVTTLTSSVNMPDSQPFTIPSVVTVNTDSLNELEYKVGANYSNFVEIELVGKITCNYRKNGMKYDWHHCTSYAASVYWDLQPGDTYIVQDLNQDSTLALKNSIKVNIYSVYNNILTGHINFSYDL